MTITNDIFHEQSSAFNAYIEFHSKLHCTWSIELNVPISKYETHVLQLTQLNMQIFIYLTHNVIA